MISLRTKYFILFLLFGVMTTAFTCKKNDDNHAHLSISNCDGLITDTAGTSEQAYVRLANAFTPNGDGINDTYFPIFRNIASYDFKVYDADDNIVFATTEFGKTWAPTTQSANNPTFYYRVQAVTKENHNIGTCGEVRLLTCVPHDSIAYFYFSDQLAPDGTYSLPTADRISECP